MAAANLLVEPPHQSPKAGEVATQPDFCLRSAEDQREGLGALQWLFCAYVAYTMLSDFLGINIPFLTALWLSALGGMMIVKRDWSVSDNRPILLAVTLSVFFLLIQVGVHNSTIRAPAGENNYLLPFFYWPLHILVVSTLLQYRRFFEKLTWTFCAIALVMVF